MYSFYPLGKLTLEFKISAHLHINFSGFLKLSQFIAPIVNKFYLGLFLLLFVGDNVIHLLSFLLVGCVQANVDVTSHGCLSFLLT